jgi:3-hydroxyisobutyrate dehydrogenase-like beta-hydroxyacid dehydrogenase
MRWLKARSAAIATSATPAASSTFFPQARRNGARLEVAALVDQFYAEVEAMGGKRWDTSSLIARLQGAVVRKGPPPRA